MIWFALISLLCNIAIFGDSIIVGDPHVKLIHKSLLILFSVLLAKYVCGLKRRFVCVIHSCWPNDWLINKSEKRAAELQSVSCSQEMLHVQQKLCDILQELLKKGISWQTLPNMQWQLHSGFTTGLLQKMLITKRKFNLAIYSSNLWL